MFHACDRCGARAAIGYRRGSSVWRWCKHHARDHDKALREAGYTRQTLDAMAASG